MDPEKIVPRKRYSPRAPLMSQNPMPTMMMMTIRMERKMIRRIPVSGNP